MRWRAVIKSQETQREAVAGRVSMRPQDVHHIACLEYGCNLGRLTRVPVVGKNQEKDHCMILNVSVSCQSGGTAIIATDWFMSQQPRGSSDKALAQSPSGPLSQSTAAPDLGPFFRAVKMCLLEAIQCESLFRRCSDPSPWMKMFNRKQKKHQKSVCEHSEPLGRKASRGTPKADPVASHTGPRS